MFLANLRVMGTERICRIALLALVLSLTGCSADPETPEARLRATLQAAESALEARDLSDVMAFVDPAYSGHDGRDYRQLRALLIGYLLRHKSIHVLYRIEAIEIDPQTGDARVALYAGVAGGGNDTLVSFDQWRGDLLYLNLTFREQTSGEWLLTQSRWERVRAESL
ncbi:MAG: hypothetical protein ABW076_06060 [Candidatus Thiodiazotropha sp.]